jgi:two-component system, OmpR family, sensor histidine kinase MprB
MELNWAPQNRWQRDRHGPVDPLSPYSSPAPIAPGRPEPEPDFEHEGAREEAPPEQLTEPQDFPPESEPPAAHRRPRPTPLAWLRKVSFRSRISILVGVAVGIAVAMASLVSYIAVSRQLEGQVNSNLQDAVAAVPGVHLIPTSNASGYYVPLPPDEFLLFQERTGDSLQVITETSYASGLPGDKRLFPLTAGAKQALKETSNNAAPVYETISGSNGGSYRVLSEAVAGVQGLVVQIGYPLTNVDNTLAFLRAALILVALGGVALAAGLGWAVGRASIRPVEDLTVTVEHITATQDLSSTIDDDGNDELARLARSFNAMLAALAASKDQQAQLVSDAGHELRTPLTSLRTNIEVLMRTKDLPAADREELLSDVDGQLQELTTLVGDLVDLARDDERQQTEPELINFDDLVARAVERAHRRATSLEFDLSLQPGQVLAQPALLERAVMNILDNAAKWSPPGGRVGVSLEADSAWHLTVTDQGPGIAPEDLPHVFERFYRAPTARSMPGSGLGLAIVKRVVNSHGGTIEMASPAAGGTRVEITLPLDQSAGHSNGK